MKKYDFVVVDARSNTVDLTRDLDDLGDLGYHVAVHISSTDRIIMQRETVVE